MPTLPISDGKGNLVPDADEQLSAVMAFPFGGKARKDAQLSQTLYGLDPSSDSEEQKIKIGHREILRIGNLNPEKTEESRIKGHHKGVTAGRILLGIAILDRDLPGKASVNKVVNYLRRTRKKTRKQSRDPLTNKSEKSIFDIWSAFKPVAHLWAADELDTLLWTARDLMSEGKDLHSMEGWGDEIHRWVDSWPLEFGDYIFRWVDSLPEGDDEDETGLLRFLTEAEHLRSYSETRFSSGMISQRRPTLDPRSTWKVPSDISLPDPILACDLPPWPDLVNFCLTEYRS